MRIGEEKRTSRETDITVSIDLDGCGKTDIQTGIGFFDHMLTAFALHGGFNAEIKAKGDLEVDMHHTVEDAGIVLGRAFASALGDKSGIKRFGSFFVPMDEALAFCSVDISGRPYLVFEDAGLSQKNMPGFDTALVSEFFRALAFNAGITLHLRIMYGNNAHHMVEAAFKAVARALSEAVSVDARPNSTKGGLGI